MTFILKQYTLTLLLMLFSCPVFAQKTYKFISSEKVSGGNKTAQLFEWSPSKSEIKFTLPSYHGKISHFENNLAFATISSELSTSFAPYQAERGLPTYKFEFILPDTMVSNFKPSQLFLQSQKPPFRNLVKVSPPYNFQGLKAVTVSIAPFTFKNGKLKVRKNFILKLRKNRNAENYPSMHPDFTTIAQQTFINFDPKKVNPQTKVTKLLIITTAEINDSGALKPFTQWKQRNGIQTDTRIYPSETELGVENLANFIAKQKGITHLMICASPLDIPAQTFYTLNSTWYKSTNWESIPLNKKEKLNKGVTSDQYYAGVDPTIQNYITNFFVSRIPLSNPADVTKMLSRIMNNATPLKKKGHILAVASNENNGRDLPDQKLVEQLTKKYKQIKFTTLFEDEHKLSETNINKALNQRPTLTIYLGHGYTDHWQTSKYQALSQTEPTLFFQPVCQTGALFTKSMAAQQCQSNAVGVYASSNNCYGSVASTLTQLTMQKIEEQKFTTMGGLLVSSTIDLALRTKVLVKPDLESGYISLQFNYFGDSSMSTNFLNQLFKTPKTSTNFEQNHGVQH